MNKEAYKQQHRQQRLAKTDNFGELLGKLMRGEYTPSFDNSHLWQFRDKIAAEIAPEIRRRQLAWAKSAPAANSV